MPDYKAVIFDFDGTLGDSMGIWDQIDIDFLAKRGIEVPDDYMEKIAHLGAYGTAIHTIERFSLSDTPEALIDEWTQMAKSAYAKVALKPGAFEYLKHLKENSIKTAIATATERSLVEIALESTGISDYIDHLVTLAEVSRGKEFPDVYLKCAELMQVSPAECLVFEDLLIGLRGAKSGGFPVVAMYDKYTCKDFAKTKATASKLIYDFSEMI